jgi:glycerol-3-phosphate acyltransferase PlsY
MLTDIALILGAYLFGSVPHLSLLARLRRLDLSGDFHESLWHRGGKIIGVIGVLGEFAKGAIPVVVGWSLGFRPAVVAIAGLAAVCGQMWPVFSRFDGEKGNSIAIAMAFALAPLPATIAIVPIIIALLFRTIPRLAKSGGSGHRAIVGGSYSRSLPLGIAAGFLLLPLASWYLGEPAAIIWGTAVLFILIMVRRLTAGLRADLKSSDDIKGILIRRLLYDRATAAWRQQP